MKCILTLLLLKLLMAKDSQTHPRDRFQRRLDPSHSAWSPFAPWKIHIVYFALRASPKSKLGGQREYFAHFLCVYIQWSWFQLLVDCVKKDLKWEYSNWFSAHFSVCQDHYHCYWWEPAATLHLKLMPSNGLLSWVGQVECEARLQFEFEDLTIKHSFHLSNLGFRWPKHYLYPTILPINQMTTAVMGRLSWLWVKIGKFHSKYLFFLLILISSS